MKNLVNLVVGAGLSGATVARLLADRGEKVLVVDKKPHIAGNSYDYKDENGISIHKYGSHIFHTSNVEVWRFVRRFADFNTYFHKVLAVIDGIETNIPFNLDTLYDVFPKNMASRIEERLLLNYEFNQKIPICDLQRRNDADLKFLAKYVYEKVFKTYTEKQWGMELDQLDSFVSARVPVLVGRNSGYFYDTYQGIPLCGYTELVQRMLESDNIKVQLNIDASDIVNTENCSDFKSVYMTSPIDEFFGYKYGVLPYRSVRFDMITFDKPYYQKNSVVNYPCNYDFTRIHEFKYYLDEKSDKTVIAKEYSEDFELGKNERFYPIPKEENYILYNKYLEDAEKIGNIKFLGRLGDYKYYDMDKAIARALEIVK